MSPRAAPIVLAATSGTGKTTLARRLVGDGGGFVFSISATTRGAREREVDGVDYHFLDEPRFKELAAEGALAEWAEVHGRFYGTPKAQLDEAAERGEHVVLDIDVQGARQIRDSVPDTKLIFVLPPDVDIMMARLTGRGTETREQIARRLRSALDELDAVPEFDCVVVNDDLERCLAEIRSIADGSEGTPPAAFAEEVRQYRDEIAEILASEYSEREES